MAITPVATISVTPTVTAGAYVTGNVVGGLLTLQGAGRWPGGSVVVTNVAASFVSGATPSVDVIFLSSLPSASTITDKAALAINAADVPKCVGTVHITTDITSLGTGSLLQFQGANVAVPVSLTGVMYAVAVARASATLGSTSDMTLSVSVKQAV